MVADPIAAGPGKARRGLVGGTGAWWGGSGWARREGSGFRVAPKGLAPLRYPGCVSERLGGE